MLRVFLNCTQFTDNVIAGQTVTLLQMKNICFIVALPAEARPLIAHFKMRKCVHPFLNVYQGSDFTLLQCGIGKLNAAASTGALLQFLPYTDALINVGIAGGQYAMGDRVLALSVRDAGSNRTWFPHLPPGRLLSDIACAEVCTVDKPSDAYEENTVFDMEASGVFSAANTYVGSAFIHCLKVVSDNPDNPIDNINPTNVSLAIEQSIPDIEKLIQALPYSTMPDTSMIDEWCRSLFNSIRHSQTEKHQTQRLMSRLTALSNETLNIDELLQSQSVRQLHQRLSTAISSSSVTYADSSS